ncbi:772_t:CDS:1, partial [Acaulospora morrowiae]
PRQHEEGSVSESSRVPKLIKVQEPMVIVESPKAVGVIKKPRRKRLPSVVDTLKPYDISEDILSMKANATFAQLLKYPDQQRNLSKILKRAKPPEETNQVSSADMLKTTAAKCYVRVGDKTMVAVLDTGAAVSIITKRLADKLRLTINEKSTSVVVTANRTRERTLGKIKDVGITIQGVTIPVKLRVIESRDETLLLGTDWFQKTKARIHFDEQKIFLRYQGKELEIPISHNGVEELTRPDESEESDYESGGTYGEFEYESEEVEEEEG